ncbi:C40 family peptidase [Nocardioides lianchengensis]|uniref:Cell wall-associated hydrolase, NlpC family n=1 Tax=Nocardioides lianchengensis TaxID=1045774 RepID=A0A1G6MVH5_9ACTN|nr:C40 family peptidase [Nocardioides lianchengensis]NYG10563.1 cell wall-associated NlpC family hydrolase/outer membrane murein-binding lipoprotein Lpp [Nocardioides lianchengensis]SDC59618.1 Cell wall-associated hydrolase, NlpC family [Nocardioides lianchengensis]
MLNGRKRFITALTGLALAGSVGFVPSSPAQAEPDIDDVQARVDRLFHEAEQASERYNDAKLELGELRSDLDALRADEKRQDAKLEVIRDQVADSLVREYSGSATSAAGQLFVSDDPSAFLTQLSTISTYNDLQGDLLTGYTAEVEALDLRRDATEARADQVAQTEEALAAEKKTADGKLAEAKDLLDELKAEERRELLSRGSQRVPSDVPASGRAGAAISYAMAQVGDAYVYGAAGPNAFDCSGLTMMAWAQAGVALPHSSAAQYSSGPHVAEGDLQPGDLVFYYSPISHVGMYIGNGLIVHAANPGAGVRVSELHSMPYVGAVRPG